MSGLSNAAAESRRAYVTSAPKVAYGCISRGPLK